ncbi:hypothetical protein C8J56DRAFT_1037873 [Mycena floridula]|nr:hypothetical protein C8J56DRAFT_1037873 [Mycena floridula]
MSNWCQATSLRFVLRHLQTEIATNPNLTPLKPTSARPTTAFNDHRTLRSSQDPKSLSPPSIPSRSRLFPIFGNLKDLPTGKLLYQAKVVFQVPGPFSHFVFSRPMKAKGPGEEEEILQTVTATAYARWRRYVSALGTLHLAMTLYPQLTNKAKKSWILHGAVEADLYQGYCIPKGSILFPCAMTRDETIYPDSEIFRPERFTIQMRRSIMMI